MIAEVPTMGKSIEFKDCHLMVCSQHILRRRQTDTFLVYQIAIDTVEIETNSTVLTVEEHVTPLVLQDASIAIADLLP